MKVYLNKEYKCVKVEDNTFVANDSSNYIRYYFVTNANGDVIDKMDDTSVIYRNTEPSYVTVAFRRADGNVIQHLMASPKTDVTGNSFFEYEITDTDGVLYKKGALEISAQFIEATLSETGGVKKVISQKVKAIAINTAHVLDNIGEEAEEYYSQYEQANNDAHAVLQTQITTNFNNIGTLQELTTDAKDDLVKAINEVDAHADANKSAIGNLSTLTTDEKTTIVGAINEVDAHADANKAEIGTLNALTTDEKATLVGAINEVDNHADNATTLANNAVATANSAVVTANEAKTTAQTAENNANSAVDTANAANATADEAKAIAQGSQRAIGFATLQAAITALNGYSNTQLKVGDNVYIVETGVPDLWVAAVEQNSVAYNYTTNDAFNDDLVENTLVQVGYYKFAYLESDGKPCTVAWQNMTVAASDWVASTEFEDFAYEAKIILSDFVNFSSIPQVVFGLTEATSGNYAPICKAGDKGVYIYSKVNTAITLPTVVTFAPNVHGASMQGGGYTNKGKWQASTTYEINDLVYNDNRQFVCIEGITSTTSPEQDTQHWQATFVANVPVKSVNGQTGAVIIEVPTKTSQLTNDSGFITANDIPDVPDTPTALPQEAVAVKSGSLPTSGWITPEEGWIENTLPANSMWWSVIYGNGKFVAVARDSTNGAYSPDGITWTEMLMPANRDWKSVTYGNDKFVAVASDSVNGAYSTDGINWTEMTLPASQSWISVTYGDGKYVAVASSKSDKGAYSTDGITWTQMSMSTSQSWQSVTYGDGKFVAVAYNSKKGAYSTDGITWTEMTLTAGHNWRITYGNDKFVAVAVDWADGAYSTDGITWTKMFMPESKFWSSVTYGDGKFVAVSSDSNKVAYSTDGINWTGMSMPAGHNGVSVTYGDGKFVAVSSGVNGVYWNVAAKQVTYVISDASVTANSDVLMELTDDGGVKASALTNGSIEVIRDTVPTQAIPYTYKVKQTNASGQFTLVNHFVPTVPNTIVESVNGQTGAVTIAVPTKTSELENDSGYVSVVPTIVQNVVCNDVDSATTLDTTITCEVGDLILAQIIVRSALTLPTDWTLLRTIPAVETTYNQTLSFAYKKATSTSETLTVTQATAGRIYTNLVRLSGAVSINYIQSCENTNTGAVSISSTKPVTSNMVIWGASSAIWGNPSPYGDWTYSPSTLDYYSVPQASRQPRLGTFIDSSGAGERTLSTSMSSSSGNAMMCGAVEIVGDEVARKGDIPTKTSQLTNDSGFITASDIPTIPTKTSQLTNDSGFVKTSEANTFTAEQTFSNANGIKANKVRNLNGNEWYNFDGTNDKFGNTTTPTIIRTSEARPKAEVPSGSATVMKELALLEDVQGDAEWSGIVQEATVSAGLYYVLMDMDEVIQTAGDPSIVFYDGTHWAHGIPYVNCGVVDGAFIIQTFTPHIDPGYDKMTATYAKVTCENGVWTQVKMDVPSKFKYRKIK